MSRGHAPASRAARRFVAAAAVLVTTACAPVVPTGGAADAPESTVAPGDAGPGSAAPGALDATSPGRPPTPGQIAQQRALEAAMGDDDPRGTVVAVEGMLQTPYNAQARHAGEVAPVPEVFGASGGRPFGASSGLRLGTTHYGGRGPEPVPGDRHVDPGVSDVTWSNDDAFVTFAVDVDTASYAIMRRHVLDERIPPAASVRVEEWLNVFDYGYPGPTVDAPHPMRVDLEAGPSPFGDDQHLLRVGLQAETIGPSDRRPANLVFLVDVSGSMRGANRLGLVQYTLQRLLDGLGANDSVAIVVYAGDVGTLLEPTSAADRGPIIDAIRSLEAGGSTNGEGGLRAAYDLAESRFVDGGINRVVLCSDGDFNVGATNDTILSIIESFRDRGINLTTLGYGMGNLNDATMEQLANRGNGNYAYIDSRNEALRAVGTRLVSTLDVLAKDVRIQVALNPEVVSSYRLIGYENRDIADEDFRREDVDAGEIGAGHDVTALIELTLAEGVSPGVEDGQLAEVFVRYEPPGGGAETEFSAPIAVSAIHSDIGMTSPAFRFAATVAEVAEQVRNSPHAATADWDAIVRLGEGTIEARDPTAAEFLDLIDTIAARIDDPLARAHVVHARSRFVGTVTLGTPAVSDESAIDVAEAIGAVRRHMRGFAYCFERERFSGGSMSGTATLVLRLEPGGRVERATIHDLSANDVATECVVSESRRIRFPRFDRDIVEVHVPLTFTP